MVKKNARWRVVVGIVVAIFLGVVVIPFVVFLSYATGGMGYHSNSDGSARYLLLNGEASYGYFFAENVPLIVPYEIEVKIGRLTLVVLDDKFQPVYEMTAKRSVSGSFTIEAPGAYRVVFHGIRTSGSYTFSWPTHRP
ncbi:MAG: hypothetical protein FD169_2490 [Bacillota bacterium]|nr:MAG: hypothetical protein FD169_2490 [Bacillota bacterium]